MAPTLKNPLMRMTLAGLALWACPTLAGAEGMILPFVRGVGADQCVKYIVAYQEGSDRYQRYTSWLQGYAARVGLEDAVERGRMTDFLHGATTDEMAAWLDRWCVDNPLKSFYLAAVAFIEHASGTTIVPPEHPLISTDKGARKP